MNKLNVSIVIPDEDDLNFECHMIVLPGVDGDFGVLYGHENMMTALRAGEAKVYEDPYSVRDIYLFPSDGAYVKVKDDKCVVITREVKQIKKSLEEEIEDVEEEVEVENA